MFKTVIRAALAMVASCAPAIADAPENRPAKRVYSKTLTFTQSTTTPAAAEDRSGHVLTRPTHPARVHRSDASSWKMKAQKQKAAKAGRRLTDCEGYAYMTQNVLGGSCR